MNIQVGNLNFVIMPYRLRIGWRHYCGMYFYNLAEWKSHTHKEEIV